jgi:gliding motility-associated-like protein
LLNQNLLAVINKYFTTFVGYMVCFYRLLLLFVGLILSSVAYGQGPNTVDDNIEMYEDTPTTFDILRNDSDLLRGINPASVDLDVSTPDIDASFVSPEGTYTVNASGVLSFSPVLNYTGVTTHLYTVENNRFLLLPPVTSRQTTITITVAPRNDPPTINGHEPLETQEATAFTIELRDLSIEDPDNDPSEFVLVVQDGANYTHAGNTVTPNANFSGPLTVYVIVNDGAGASSARFPVTVTVNAVNSAPSITGVSTLTTEEDTPLPLLVGNFTIADSDIGDTFTLIVQDGTGYTHIGNQITPTLNYNGEILVQVVVNDGTEDSDVFPAPVTVTAVNDFPRVTGHDDLSTLEATPITIILDHLDIEDPDSDPAGFTLLVQPGNYTLSGNTVTPLPNFNGVLEVPLIVNDGVIDGNSGLFTLRLNVTAVNSSPTISAIGPQSTAESTATSPITFTVNDAETAPGDLRVSATSSVTTLVPNTGFSFGGSDINRNVIITPTNNQTGITRITITVSDGDETATSVFDLSVTSVNEAPTISAITAKSTTEDEVSAPITFTVGDSDTAVGLLSVTGSSSDKTLVPDVNFVFSGSGASRSVTITPAPNQTGTTVITLQVSDGSLTQETTFSFSVTPVNDRPAISAIDPQTTAESTATPAIPFTVSDVESDPDLLTITAVSNNLTLVPNGNITLGGTGASRTVVVTPVTGQNGVALITLTVSDGASTTPTSFQLTVSSFNDPPTITSISEQTTPEDVATGAIPFTIGDADTQITSLAVTGSSSDKTLVPDANINFTGADISRAVTITPAPNQNGTTTITITVRDGTSSKEISFPLVVTPENDAPTITTIAAQNSAENVATPALSFTVADVDSDVSALTVSGSSSNKTLVPDDRITLGGSAAARTVTVAPAAGQSGTTTITVSVSDGSLVTSTSFTFTVTSVNDAPTITSINSQTIKEDTATPALPFTIGDAETPATSLTVTGSSSDKKIVPDENIVFGGEGANRTVTITPAANQNGSVTITLTVGDLNASKQMAFPLVITPENDAPVITGSYPITIPEDTELTITANEHLIISDPDGDKNFKVTVHAGEKYGFAGTATVKPNTDFDGELIVNVSVNDGSLESAWFPVKITVSDVNIAPKIIGQKNPNPIPIEENTSYELTPARFEITDPDNDPRDFKLIISEGKNYSLSGPEKTIITPLANYQGDLDVIVMVSDGKNQSLPFSVQITVVPKSDEPNVIGQDALVTNEDVPIILEGGNFTITGTNKNIYTMTVLDGDNYSVEGLTVKPDPNINGILEVGIQVGIGAKLSGIFKAQVYVIPVNDKPQIVAMETNAILYEPGSGPISISENFDCEDIDNNLLNYAEVGILDSSFSPLNDELIFEPSDASPIRGVYDASKGVLSLIGYGTPAEYESAIRSVKYNYRLTLDENGEQSQISTQPKAVYVELSDGQLLSDRHERPIELETSVDLDIPTAFTPNVDLVNDTWAVRPVTNSDQFDKTIIRVYNKRGLLVYESIGLEKEWDGTFNGEVLPMDTYYYTIDLQVSFVNKTYKGAVTLLR